MRKLPLLHSGSWFFYTVHHWNWSSPFAALWKINGAFGISPKNTVIRVLYERVCQGAQPDVIALSCCLPQKGIVYCNSNPCTKKYHPTCSNTSLSKIRLNSRASKQERKKKQIFHWGLICSSVICLLCPPRVYPFFTFSQILLGN